MTTRPRGRDILVRRAAGAVMAAAVTGNRGQRASTPMVRAEYHF